MLIPLDKKCLYKNINNDTMDIGSAAGDIIIVQDTTRTPNEFSLSDYSSLPNDDDLLEYPPLKSRKNPLGTKILGAYVFKKFSVNKIDFESNKYFLVFIRQALTGKRKITLCAQPTRNIEDKNIDNSVVLNDLSKTINDQGFIVDALNYIESEDKLDFIVNLYGSDAVTSTVFTNTNTLERALKNYPSDEIQKWSNLEFSIQCLNLLRKYGLERKSILLENENYCNKKFKLKLNDSFLSIIKEKLTNDDEEKVYTKNTIFFDDKEFHIFVSWKQSTRNNFWEWVLDQIMEVSDDVNVIKQKSQVKYIKLPSVYESSIDRKASEIEIKYNINDENYKRYFQENDLKIGDEIMIVNSNLTHLLSFNLYEIKNFKEQSMILHKKQDLINKNFENEILEMIKEED